MDGGEIASRALARGKGLSGPVPKAQGAESIHAAVTIQRYVEAN